MQKKRNRIIAISLIFITVILIAVLIPRKKTGIINTPTAEVKR